MGRRILVVPYDPLWPALYEAARRELAEAFAGSGARIEHVGSTAVPGLAAKPIIDIMVGLSTLSDAEERIGALDEFGYHYVPEYEAELPDRRYFRKPLEHPRTHHVHCALFGGEFWTRHLLFRDFLRANPDRASAYGELKVRLAEAHGDDRAAYLEAKGSFIRRVVTEAARQP